MGYTPHPTVVTGQVWSAANQNTYVRDNFAAGVPDIFSAKGQLAVATAADTATALAVGANNKVLMADSAQASGMKWGDILTVFSASKTNTSWDGDNKTVANYTLNVSSFDATIPSTAKGLLITVSASWVAADNGSLVNVCPSGVTANCILVRALVPGYFVDNQGVVPLDGSGNFRVRVVGATATVYLDVWGYIL